MIYKDLNEKDILIYLQQNGTTLEEAKVLYNWINQLDELFLNELKGCHIKCEDLINIVKIFLNVEIKKIG